MKILTVLKGLINFIFLAFLIAALTVILIPFYHQSYSDYSSSEVFSMLILVPVFHLTVTFLILYYLRKFVYHSLENTPLDELSRKYLKLSGIFCVISGIIKIPQLTGLITFYNVTGELKTSMIASQFLDFDSLFFIILIGIFFIYLSMVLDKSDELRQENKLTI